MVKLKVCVAYAAAPNREDKPSQVEIPVKVNAHANVAMAIRQSGVLEQFPEIPFPDIDVGIYSQRVALDSQIEAGDRIEIYRPLLIDPKQARLLRAEKASNK